MNLKKIKLSGFKSFVDPTVIALPSHLVAVVGPNGCGKSNVIDAVTWVMGESSAKYLRGELLTDVIFNGSSSRKPIGQASVELIFDNQDASIGGEYASYSEISIRRLITREGDSSYFLNGVKCRRKDVIDIFLGTGLGPRSYSIIGQNMISRIIEARPEEMRVYLEEAAGVSKYKERRRETENRIQHTKENLDRLNDIRMELEKQLANLQRQASAAEKFKLLKQQERTLRAEWYTIQWRELDAQLLEYTLQVQQQETGLEAKQAELSRLDLSIEQSRNEQQLTADVFQEVQKRYYAVGNEVARLEQEIRHHKEKNSQWQSDLERIQHENNELLQSSEDIALEIEELSKESEQLSPAATQAKEEVDSVAKKLTSAEDALQTWQTTWDQFNQRAARSTQTAQVEQTKIQHLEQKINFIKQNQIKIQQEQSQIDVSVLENEASAIEKELSDVTSQVNEKNSQLSNYADKINQLRTSLQTTTSRLDTTRNEIQKLNGKKSSLEALQQTAIGQHNHRVVQWLDKHELNKYPRLAQELEVAAGWEKAVEKVLGSYLQAICVEEITDLIPKIEELKEGNLCFVAKEKTTSHSQISPRSLAAKVKSSWPLSSLLASVLAVDTEAEAVELCKTLASHESVITRSGLWMSAAWIRVSFDEKPESGIFQREQELKFISEKMNELEAARDEFENELKSTQTQIKDLETKKDELQKISNQIHVRLAELQAQQKTKKERISELTKRASSYENELENGLKQLEEAETQLKTAKHTWEQALQELESQSEQRTSLTQEKEQFRESVQVLRIELNRAKEKKHELEMRLQTVCSQLSASQQTLLRIQTQITSLNDRKQGIESEIASAVSITELENNLSDMLQKCLTVENELSEARTNLTTVEQKIRSHETQRQDIERDLNRVRNQLEALRLEWHQLKIKSENLIQQVKETGFVFEDILRQLSATSTAEEWAIQLEQTLQRINRLGAINLVAIEEYASCLERKEYLDSQYNDLQEGLTTLEEAIEKIDKETRARFKETFDTVNTHFQTLFPRIFGGGHANMELTGDNLLDAGISLMASPPGKRNSTIHLLSGGEKAMTAIALIFSIFQLNPAPFCLLDEVDAPLDDANIGRFCNLVKSMSDKTQFIFISHNKLAIEMGEHLIGVTMHEPGVSRLVTVDIKEAMQLAGQ